MAATPRLPFEVEGRPILLDRRRALHRPHHARVINELFDFGRPASVQLAVLVDRGGRQLPIEPAFSAARVSLAPGVSLRLEKPSKATSASTSRPGRALMLKTQPSAQQARRADPPAVHRGPAREGHHPHPRHREQPSCRSTTARSRRCRCCAASRCSTCSSRTAPARARPSRSPPSASADVLNLDIARSSTAKGETLLDTVANLSAMHADMFVVRQRERRALPDRPALRPACARGQRR